jgi:ABC-2 type transport system ATP-binding protein
MDLFVASEVTKRYANHTALNKVSINVPEQSIFGLLGPNGAGKTSLIRIINMITAPDEGQLFMNGEKLQPKHKDLIGYLPEERGLYKKMKVGEQAVYLAQLKGLTHKEATIRLKEWFKKFDIYAWWNRKVEELSKGMQQKIQFIVTVIHNPKLLIFDEPFSGFDPINANIIRDEILRLKENGATIIFSTHNMASVEELCDHIALINKSNKILEGKVKDIKNTYKTNTYQIEMLNFNGNLKEKLNENFEIAEENIQDEIFNAKIKLLGDTKPNDLIKILMNYSTIHSFNEIIPTMNDIFITKVGEDQQWKNGNSYVE